MYGVHSIFTAHGWGGGQHYTAHGVYSKVLFQYKYFMKHVPVRSQLPGQLEGKH